MAKNVPSRRALFTAIFAAVPGAAAAQSSLLDQGRSLLNTAPGGAAAPRSRARA